MALLSRKARNIRARVQREPKPGLALQRCLRRLHSIFSLEHPRCVFQLMKKQYERYHTGDGGAHHGHSAGSISQGQPDLYTSVRQRRRHEKSVDHYLCGGMDAAQLRHADYSYCGHAAIADGQCGTRGWRP